MGGVNRVWAQSCKQNPCGHYSGWFQSCGHHYTEDIAMLLYHDTNCIISALHPLFILSLYRSAGRLNASSRYNLPKTSILTAKN